MIWLTSELLDPEKFRDVLSAVSLTTLLGFFAFMTLSRVILTARWTVIARQQLGLKEARFGYLFRTQLLAEFASIWLPSIIAGEGVRIVRLSTATRKIREATASIVLDRVSGIVSLILVCIPFLLMLPAYGDRLPFSAGAGGLLLAALGLGLVAAPFLLRRYRGTARVLRTTADILKSAPLLSLPLLISLLGYGAVFVAYYLLLTKVAGVSASEAALISLVSRLGRFVPVSVCGFGGVEGLTYILGELVGVNRELLVMVVALNVLVKYALSAFGVLLELLVSGKALLLDLYSRPDVASPEDDGSNEVTTTRPSPGSEHRGAGSGAT
jgi:hypothetical protein